MTRAEVELKVREILAAKLDRPLADIGPEARLVEDLGVDSFSAIELMFDLEEAFGLKIPDSDIDRVRSVSQISDYLWEWRERADAAASRPPDPIEPPAPPAS